MIPRMAIEPQSLATFPEAPPTLGRHECGEGCDHGRVPRAGQHDRTRFRRERPRRAGVILVAVREHDLTQARGVVQPRECSEDRTFGAEGPGVDHREPRI